jgi:energy-converting hydrogenase Eha subunit E
MYDRVVPEGASPWRRRVVGAQAFYYTLTGVWPVIHMASFEAVTGPKVDDWLVKMVGLLAAAIGLSLGAAVLRGETRNAVVGTLALTSAMAFAAIDLWYGLSGRISPIYLADAAVQIGIIAALAWSSRSRRYPTSNPPNAGPLSTDPSVPNREP